MPPRKWSRHLFAGAIRETGDERVHLTDRVRFGYKQYTDNVLHTVVEGDDLFRLAGYYYASIPRGCGLWWVIADFQPEPIHDPTIALLPGTILVVPSVRTVIERVFARERVREATP
jgi:hypothetical protein